MRRHLSLTRLANKRVRSIHAASEPRVEKVVFDEAEETSRIVEAAYRPDG
jgi:hypothetical protein